MKNILTLILVFFFVNLFSQTTVQGTVLVEQPNTASIYILPSEAIIGQNATNNIVSLNLSVSIDATGLPVAPVVTFSNNLVGISFTSVDLIEGRHVYTFAGNSGLNAFTWTGGVALKIIDIIFPVDPIVGQKFPRLADYANAGGGPSSQSYFYVDVNGTDYTNYVQYFYSGNQGTTPGSTYVESLTPLPITLKSFDAIKHSPSSAKLDWTTAKEVNSDYFGIERSIDGSTWDEIARVKAAGDSNVDIAYDYIDDRLPLSRTNGQVFYYRLRMTDLDGAFKYSDVRGVNFDKQALGPISIYPNPTTEIVNIDLSEVAMEDGDVFVSVYDMSGRLVMTKKIIGSGIELIKVDQLPSDAYNFIIRQGEQIHQQRVIKID
jgi:hypothetical protein